MRIRDQVQQIVTVDDDVRDHFRVDVSAVVPNDSDKFHFEIKTDMDRYTYFYDEWGIGWKMPKIGGLYYDMFDHPLKGDFTKADVDHYSWPDPGNTGRFKRDAGASLYWRF